MIPTPRPSLEALPSWLGHLPAVAPTPIRAYKPPEEGVLQRALRNPRLPLHVALLAIVFGIIAAGAAGAVRGTRSAAIESEMVAFATAKAAELRAMPTLQAKASRAPLGAIAVGGSLTEDLPGFFDSVEGTNGRRFLRRWDIDAAPTGSRRVVVRMMPLNREAGRTPLDVTTILPRP